MPDEAPCDRRCDELDGEIARHRQPCAEAVDGEWREPVGMKEAHQEADREVRRYRCAQRADEGLSSYGLSACRAEQIDGRGARLSVFGNPRVSTPGEPLGSRPGRTVAVPTGRCGPQKRADEQAGDDRQRTPSSDPECEVDDPLGHGLFRRSTWRSCQSPTRAINWPPLTPEAGACDRFRAVPLRRVYSLVGAGVHGGPAPGPSRATRRQKGDERLDRANRPRASQLTQALDVA
jgi:hypothetical protein